MFLRTITWLVTFSPPTTQKEKFGVCSGEVGTGKSWRQKRSFEKCIEDVILKKFVACKCLIWRGGIKNSEVNKEDWKNYLKNRRKQNSFQIE